jgi:hypothetical protein
MANVDRPNGFRPIKFTSGAPWTGQMRAIGVTDSADMFVGDFISLTSGLAAVSATNDATLLGVAMGFGKRDPNTGYIASAADPTQLEQIYYDDSASTHTDYVVFYVPARDMIFEVQSAVDFSASLPGALVDLLATGGDTATGRSLQEITTDSNHDFVIVEKPEGPGTDQTLIHANIYVQAVQTETAFD